VSQHPARRQCQSPEPPGTHSHLAALPVQGHAQQVSLQSRLLHGVRGEAHPAQLLLHKQAFFPHRQGVVAESRKVVDVEHRRASASPDRRGHRLVRDPRPRLRDPVSKQRRVRLLHQRHRPGPAHRNDPKLEPDLVARAAQLTAQLRRKGLAPNRRKDKVAAHVRGQQVLIVAVLDVTLATPELSPPLQLQVAKRLRRGEESSIRHPIQLIHTSGVKNDSQVAALLPHEKDPSLPRGRNDSALLQDAAGHRRRQELAVAAATPAKHRIQGDLLQ